MTHPKANIVRPYNNTDAIKKRAFEVCLIPDCDATTTTTTAAAAAATLTSASSIAHLFITLISQTDRQTASTYPSFSLHGLYYYTVLQPHFQLDHVFLAIYLSIRLSLIHI